MLGNLSRNYYRGDNHFQHSKYQNWFFFFFFFFLFFRLFCFVFEESNCQFRNLTEHLRHCEEVDIRGTEASWLNGVNHRSDLQYFDLCIGALLADVMHDVLAFFGSRSYHR